ncbi:MAG: hypothetical protein RR585_01940 [Coprobacillus sp.]
MDEFEKSNPLIIPKGVEVKAPCLFQSTKLPILPFLRKHGFQRVHGDFNDQNIFIQIYSNGTHNIIVDGNSIESEMSLKDKAADSDISQVPKLTIYSDFTEWSKFLTNKEDTVMPFIHKYHVCNNGHCYHEDVYPEMVDEGNDFTWSNVTYSVDSNLLPSDLKDDGEKVCDAILEYHHGLVEKPNWIVE